MPEQPEQPKDLTLENLKQAVRSAAAFRLHGRLDGLDGDGGKVFPPTYAGGVYAVEDRRIDGKVVRCALLDSVQAPGQPDGRAAAQRLPADVARARSRPTPTRRHPACRSLPFMSRTTAGSPRSPRPTASTTPSCATARSRRRAMVGDSASANPRSEGTLSPLASTGRPLSTSTARRRSSSEHGTRPQGRAWTRPRSHAPSSLRSSA